MKSAANPPVLLVYLVFYDVYRRKTIVAANTAERQSGEIETGREEKRREKQS